MRHQTEAEARALCEEQAREFLDAYRLGTDLEEVRRLHWLQKLAFLDGNMEHSSRRQEPRTQEEIDRIVEPSLRVLQQHLQEALERSIQHAMTTEERNGQRLMEMMAVLRHGNKQDEREYPCPFCTCIIALPYRDITRAVTCQVCETVWDVRRDAYGYFQVFREMETE